MQLEHQCPIVDESEVRAAAEAEMAAGTIRRKRAQTAAETWDIYSEMEQQAVCDLQAYSCW